MKGPGTPGLVGAPGPAAAVLRALAVARVPADNRKVPGMHVGQKAHDARATSFAHGPVQPRAGAYHGSEKAAHIL